MNPTVPRGVAPVVAPSAYDLLPPSAAEWLSSGGVKLHNIEPGWREGWDACRNRIRTLIDGVDSAEKPSGCIHDPARPQGCFRVRCQLGKRCAELPEGRDA